MLTIAIASMHPITTLMKCQGWTSRRRSWRTLIGTTWTNTLAPGVTLTLCFMRWVQLIIAGVKFPFCDWQQMKYWRYRMYLLPKDDPVMKRIIDENLEHCDIYVADNSQVTQKQQVEEFLRFVETHLNKIRRVKKPRVRRSFSLSIQCWQSNRSEAWKINRM